MAEMGSRTAASTNRDKKSMQQFTLTHDHITLLRHLVFLWTASESGAPYVDVEQPFGSPEIEADIVRLLGRRGDTQNANEFRAPMDLYNELGAALEIFARFAELSPGVYAYEHQLRQHGTEFLANADSFDTIPIPQEPTLSFAFTHEHARLIRGASYRGLSIDSKRPYGDMTSFFIDMADLLDMPFTRDARGTPQFSDAQIAHFTQLHHDMLFALTVFLRYARIEPGLFTRATWYEPWDRHT